MTFKHITYKLTHRPLAQRLALLALCGALGVVGWSHLGINAAVRAYSETIWHSSSRALAATAQVTQANPEAVSLRASRSAVSPAQDPGLSETQRRKLAELVTAVQAGKLFSLEERFVLDRFTRNESINALEADTVISRVLLCTYVTRQGTSRYMNQLLIDYRQLVASRGRVILDEGKGQSANPPNAPSSPIVKTGVSFTEGFADITTLPGAGWATINNSSPVGTINWFQGNDAVFPAQAGAVTSYIGANFNNTTGANTISNWLLTPQIALNNGDQFTFYTRTTSSDVFPDRLQVRLSTAGASTDVGATSTSVGVFTTLLLDINPTLVTGVYPIVWTQFTVTVSGLGAPNTNGRLAFRYFVTSGGPSGANSDYIGIDTFAYIAAAVTAAPTITKGFSPAVILSGGTSVATLTLNNSNATALTGGAFTDTLIGMSASGGLVVGSCVGTQPGALVAGATALSFSSILVPASSSCTVNFIVTSSTLGERSNTTSGVTTTQTPTAGAASNPAILTVLAAPTIGKAFSPTTITAGGTSMVTLTLSNAGNPFGLVGAFTDTLTNMTAVGGPIGGTCGTLAAVTLAANATNLSFSGIAMPANGSCMVTFPVRSNVAGVQPNTTSGMTTDFTGAATGPPSNTAMLTVNAPTMQTIAKAFSPTSIVQGGTSTVTLTLSNTLPSGVLASFSDALTNMVAVGGPIGSTCATLATITIPANATNVNFSGIVIPGAGSCAVSFAVTSNVVGVNPNTTSGVTTDQSPVAGPPSNTANLTVTAAPTPLAGKAVRNDFDGDGKSDLAQWRSDFGEWQVKFTSDGELHHIALVEPNDKDEYVAVAADFDGDRKTDAAVWRSRDGRWLIKLSTDGELMKAQFGLTGDVPMPADYDGDGRADLAFWRNRDGLHIQRSSNLTEEVVYLGESGDMPVVGDFDGDGRTDIAVFRESTGSWLVRDTATGMLSDVLFGQSGDTPFAADFDGDGKDDLTVRRASTVYVRRSIDQSVEVTPWNSLSTDEVIVFGDYDGDGKAEFARWRAAKAGWDILLRQSPRTAPPQ